MVPVRWIVLGKEIKGVVTSRGALFLWEA